MKIKYLLLLFLMLPFISACDRSDDVMGIFTGKTWKLTYIVRKDQRTPYNFWDNQKTLKEAQLEVEKKGAYTLTFSGEETDDIIDGTFEGILGTPLRFNGKWQADGKSNAFSTSGVRSGGNKALLDSYFMYGIENATRYSGNYDNLYLYYTYKDKSNKEIELCLVFHVDK